MVLIKRCDCSESDYTYKIQKSTDAILKRSLQFANNSS